MPIYLDHNATTPLDERVLAAMLPYFGAQYGNASSLYRPGRDARAAIETAREQVAALVRAHPSQVVFTGGGTEANNLALKGAVVGHQLRTLAVSAIEHASVLAPARGLRKQGVELHLIAADPLGQVSVSALEPALAGPGPALVSVMLANNETGVVQDVAALAARAKAARALIHTDAVQAAGKIAVDFTALGVHLMSLSAHKIYGPKGVGALVVDKALDVEPLLHGGGQEKGRRAGTENVAAIVGFGAAAELAAAELESRTAHVARLRSRLETGLRELPGVTVFAATAQRLPSTTFFGLPGIDGEALLMALDACDIAVASGAACDSGSAEPSHVLRAMGVDEALARGAVRVSLGQGNCEADIDALLAALRRLGGELRNLPVMAP